MVENRGIEEFVKMKKIPGGFELELANSSLFTSGSATLQRTIKPVLTQLAKKISSIKGAQMEIQGHTDDEQISTEKFPTNWELSAGRATAVLRYFVDKGAEPERMTATGYADTFPLGRNDTVPGRARNRRVEFVLEKEK